MFVCNKLFKIVPTKWNLTNKLKHGDFAIALEALSEYVKYGQFLTKRIKIGLSEQKQAAIVSLKVSMNWSEINLRSDQQ